MTKIITSFNLRDDSVSALTLPIYSASTLLVDRYADPDFAPYDVGVQCLYPTKPAVPTSFADAVDGVAASIKLLNVPITVCYSGGIDSLVMLAALLKAGVDVKLAMTHDSYSECWVPEVLTKVVALPQIPYVGNDFMTTDRWVSGDIADMLVGSHFIESLKFDTGNAYTNSAAEYVQKINNEILTYAYNAGNKFLPFKIETVAQLYWWFEFNYIFQNLTLSPLVKTRSPSSIKTVYDNKVDFFEHPYLQGWAINNAATSKATDYFSVKDDYRAYISDYFSYDFSQTKKSPSAGRLFSYNYFNRVFEDFTADFPV